MQVNAYSADVKDFASVKKAFEAACSESGNVTAVVLSHGVAVPGTFEDTSIETMEHMLDTNLKGNIHAIKAALPFIKSSKSAPASIAIFSSQAGQVCAWMCTPWEKDRGKLTAHFQKDNVGLGLDWNFWILDKIICFSCIAGLCQCLDSSG